MRYEEENESKEVETSIAGTTRHTAKGYAELGVIIKANLKVSRAALSSNAFSNTVTRTATITPNSPDAAQPWPTLAYVAQGFCGLGLVGCGGPHGSLVGQPIRQNAGTRHL